MHTTPAPDWHYYSPINPRTGALHAQPSSPQIRLEAAGVPVLLPDHRCALIPCDSLDAPLCVPAGGTRGSDFEAGNGRLGIAHVWRDGAHA